MSSLLSRSVGTCRAGPCELAALRSSPIGRSADLCVRRFRLAAPHRPRASDVGRGRSAAVCRHREERDAFRGSSPAHPRWSCNRSEASGGLVRRALRIRGRRAPTCNRGPRTLRRGHRNEVIRLLFEGVHEPSPDVVEPTRLPQLVDAFKQEANDFVAVPAPKGLEGPLLHVGARRLAIRTSSPNKAGASSYRLHDTRMCRGRPERGRVLPGARQTAASDLAPHLKLEADAVQAQSKSPDAKVRSCRSVGAKAASSTRSSSTRSNGS